MDTRTKKNGSKGKSEIKYGKQNNDDKWSGESL